MIDDENHPEFIRAGDDLSDRLRGWASRGRDAAQAATYRELGQLIYDWRVRWRQRGVDAPQMVPLVMHRHDAPGVTVDLVRADLEPAAVRRWVLEATRSRPGVTAVDLANAVRNAFPHLKNLDDVVDEIDAKLIKRVN